MENYISKDEVIQHENKLYEAMKLRNLEMLDNLLHDSLLFVLPSGEVITKETDLETYRQGIIKFEQIDSQIEHLNIIADLAVLTVVLKLEGSFNNDKFSAKFRYIRFWKKFQDGIKVIGGSGKTL